jgi:PIN domain nuclease of toxin-antitoxin system
VAITVLDASVVSAFLDANDAHHAAAVEAVARARGQELILPSSAYAEVLVDPWRAGSEAVAVVKRFLAELGVRIEPLTADVAERAARLRSGHRGLRLPDALVLATADALDAIALTADRSWPRVSRRARIV